jgi:hypothetical protein
MKPTIFPGAASNVLTRRFTSRQHAGPRGKECMRFPCTTTAALVAAAFALVLLQPAPSQAQAASPKGPAPQQAPPPQPPPAARPKPDTLRVFLDCPDGDCDYDFLRQEITFVNLVRDRKDADVHVLVTSQQTGGGGWDCTINLIGQRAFEKMDRLIHYVTKSTDTADENRKGIARMLKLGLVQYVTDMPVAGELDVVHKRPTAEAQGPSRGARDPWNSWVFSTSLSSSVSGASSQNSASISGSFSANRVTEAWKITSSASGYYNSTKYTFDDGSTFTALTRDFSSYGMIVKSLGAHWAAGGSASVGSSTYSNQRVALRVAPAIEYDLFPYAQATRRQLTVNYGIGFNRFDYREETIFGKVQENLIDHKVSVSFALKQPWGSNYTSFEVSQYLSDLSKNHLVLYNGTSVRLFKGFSLSVSGSVSRVRDQIYLPMGEATPEEVLASLRQLATSYRYSVRVGFSYSFGSIFNNVVNPRFGGSSGGIYYY